jgi:hypothetical protein
VYEVVFMSVRSDGFLSVWEQVDSASGSQLLASKGSGASSQGSAACRDFRLVRTVRAHSEPTAVRCVEERTLTWIRELRVK